MDALMKRRGEKRQYRDCYGNRALLDIDGNGIVLIVNPQYRRSRHGKPQRTLVHRFETVHAALQAMRTLSGTTWTEVGRECLFL